MEVGSGELIGRAVAIVMAAALAVVGAVAIRHLREQPPPPPSAVRLAFPPPADAELGFGDHLLDAAFASDGTQIVFVATSKGVTQLWRRGLDQERAEPIAGTEGAQLPAWKQTGTVVSFFAGGRLKAVGVGAQVPEDRRVPTDLGAVATPGGAAWLADGSLLYSDRRGPIQRLREGRVTAATVLSAGDVMHLLPTPSGSDAFVYVAVREDGRRMARLVSGDRQRDLTVTSGQAVLIDNDLLHVRDGVLLRYRLNPETGALSNRGVPLALNVGLTPDGRALFAASPRLVLHAPATPRARQLVWLDPSGTRLGSTGDVGAYWQVRLSPDDRRVAVTATDPLLRTLDIVLMPTTGTGYPLRLTSSITADTDPVWSPDGLRVLFRSLQGGQPNLFARDADGQDPTDERIVASEQDETPTDWNGRYVLFHARSAGALDVLMLDTRTGASGPVLNNGFNETDARWSPDGRWMTYVTDDSGRPDIYARRSDGTRVRVSFGGGVRPRWSRDGRTLFFLRGSQMMRADMAAGNVPAFDAPRVLFDARGVVDFDVAHGSDRLLAIVPVSGDLPATVGGLLNWASLGGS